MTVKATPTPGAKLLTPNDHTLVMIDFQSQMAFATQSIDAVNLRNNAALVAHAAAGFKVSDHPHDGGREELLRPDVQRDHRRLPGPGDARPHLDEHLGRRRRRSSA